MPIYEYRCKDCKEVSSYLLNFNSKKEILCKKCQSKNVVKIISQIAKGSCSSCSSSSCSTCSSCK